MGRPGATARPNRIGGRAAGAVQGQAVLNSALLIVDDVGVRPLDRHGTNVLFRLISARYERGSIVLTSNKTCATGQRSFIGDEVLATACPRGC